MSGPAFPEWLRDAVFYQIYPQSFYDANGDGIGDLAGISAKLDYVRELGCNAVWINPCFASPFRDAGYDVTDYYRVAARYGSNRDLQRLFDQAHAQGVRVCLDLVPGHTSLENRWFQESCRPEPNRYSNWFIWTGSWTEEPGPGLNAVRGYAERDGNFVVNFFYAQPALNYGFQNLDPARPWQLPTDHPDVRAVREEIKGIIRFWLDLGADGFRVDMASSLVKNDPDKQGTIAFWREVREMLDRDYPEAVLISEWSDPRKAVRAGFQLDMLIHLGDPAYTSLFRHERGRSANDRWLGRSFFDRAGKGDIFTFLEHYLPAYEATKGRGIISLPTGNHDLPRLSLDRDRLDLEQAFAFLLSLPGVPIIYYGDEIGLRYQGELPTKEGGYNRTGSRTPMQWSSGEKAGFSKAAPEAFYLPVDRKPGAANVEEQRSDPASLLSFVKAMIGFRHSEPALQADGAFRVVFAEPGRCPFVFERVAAPQRLNGLGGPAGRAELPPGQRFLCAFNPAERRESARFSLPGVSGWERAGPAGLSGAAQGPRPKGAQAASFGTRMQDADQASLRRGSGAKDAVQLVMPPRSWAVWRLQ